MLKKNLNNLLVLNAVRVTGNRVKFPVTDNWQYLEPTLSDLLELGWLVVTDGVLQVSDVGKKHILWFLSVKKDVLQPLEVYKEILVNQQHVDGRLPISAFTVRNKLRGLDAMEHLFCISALLVWDEFFEEVKEVHSLEDINWQAEFFKDYYQRANVDVHPNVWLKLGRNSEEAVMTAERLLSPKPKRGILEIKKDILYERD